MDSSAIDGQLHHRALDSISAFGTEMAALCDAAMWPLLGVRRPTGPRHRAYAVVAMTVPGLAVSLTGPPTEESQRWTNAHTVTAIIQRGLLTANVDTLADPTATTTLRSHAPPPPRKQPLAPTPVPAAWMPTPATSRPALVLRIGMLTSTTRHGRCFATGVPRRRRRRHHRRGLG